MSNISDLIEQFILDTMGQDDSIEIARNSLAEYFNCAPSQINYVLTTRFTLDRGFNKVSKRGGGGYIKISRLNAAEDDVATMVLESVGDELDYKRMEHIVSRLAREKIISHKEANIIKDALSDNALNLPVMGSDRVRANCFKSVLIGLMSKEDK